MKAKTLIAVLSVVLVFASCTKEYDCADLQIRPAFIGFSPTDIDTFVLRKFKPANNFQNLIDTFIVNYGNNGYYQVSNDTTSVFVTDGKNGIKAGYDWQIFIPAKNKTVFVSEIVSEKKTGRRGYGIFSLDPGPGCTNDIFSAKLDNQLVNFSNPNISGYYLFIHN
jgi:hypothetical protein